MNFHIVKSLSYLALMHFIVAVGKRGVCSGFLSDFTTLYHDLLKGQSATYPSVFPYSSFPMD